MENNTNISQDANLEQNVQQQVVTPVGTEGSSQQTVPANTVDNQAGGPNSQIAEMRREAEEFARLKADPTYAEFQTFKQQQEAAAQAAKAQQMGTSPELLNEFEQMKAMLANQQAQAQETAARDNFSSFATQNNMDQNVQMEFLGFLEQNLPPQMQQAALMPGFNYGLFVDAFARSKGLIGNAQPQVDPKAATFIPGHGTGTNQSSAMNEQLTNRIKNLVEKG